MDKKTHDEQHSPRTAPQPGCEWCKREVFRRTRRCHGDGSSSVKIPAKKPD